MGEDGGKDSEVIVQDVPLSTSKPIKHERSNIAEPESYMDVVTMDDSLMIVVEGHYVSEDNWGRPQFQNWMVTKIDHNHTNRDSKEAKLRRNR